MESGSLLVPSKNIRIAYLNPVNQEIHFILLMLQLRTIPLSLSYGYFRSVCLTTCSITVVIAFNGIDFGPGLVGPFTRYHLSPSLSLSDSGGI